MQIQNLLNLGQALKEKREDQGLSLEKISDWTKINVSTLQAIEEAQVDRLPVYAYLRGFILSYAKALGMDEKEIERELKALASHSENSQLHSMHPSRSVSSSSATENFVEKDLRLTPVILAVSILFILGSILVFTNIIQSYKKGSEQVENPADNSVPVDKFKESEKEQKDDTLSLDTPNSAEQHIGTKEHKEEISPSVQKSKVELVDQNQKETNESETHSAPTNEPKLINNQKSSLELVVKALGEVKVFYQVDGQEKKAVSLKEDQFEVLQGKKGILIETDDSDLIYIFHNGEDKGLFGSGGKKEKLFN